MRALWIAILMALSGAALVPDAARGQVSWETPLMVAPETPAGWGVYLVDPSPGQGVGVMTTWRGSSAPGGIGYRLGLAEGRGDDVSVYGGFDLSGLVASASNEFPVNMAWVVGAGLGVGDDVLLSLPLGLAFGRSVQADQVWFNPYVAPRVTLDAWFGDGSDLELGLSVDLGVDISFDPGWHVRFGGSIGDHEALAIGINFRVL